MATAKKTQVVDELTQELKKAKAIVFTDYKGLTHKQMEQLKNVLKKTKAKYVVTKNTLLAKALSNIAVNTSGMEKDLTGPTAALIILDDIIAPVKELVKFIKTAQLPAIKFAIMDQNKLSKEEIMRLATLPAREVLLGKLVGSLFSPVYGLHNALSWNLRKLVYALEAVKTKK